MNSQIKRVIAKGKPLSVIKGLITKELLRLDRVKFDEAIKAEYDLLFPKYRDMTDSEKLLHIEDLELQDDTEKETIEYPKVEIDYSQDENYITLEQYKNETRVIQEAVEATYDEDGMILTEAIQEVSELVRQYTPIEVTDEMIQVELDKLEYVPKEKIEAQKYLNDTDWMVVRYAEQGVEIPQEIKDKRQECRDIL